MVVRATTEDSYFHSFLMTKISWRNQPWLQTIPKNSYRSNKCGTNIYQHSLCCTQHCSDWCRTEIRDLTHKRHPHILPPWKSYGMSIVRISAKIGLSYNGTALYLSPLHFKLTCNSWLGGLNKSKHLAPSWSPSPHISITRENGI